MLWTGLSPSFCWLATSLSALIKFFTQTLRYCMRFENLGLTGTFACLHHQLQCFFPPNVVLQEKAVAMRAQIRQSNTSLSSGWRDDAPQVTCSFQHNSSCDAQIFLPHLSPLSRRPPVFFQRPIPCFYILPSLLLSAQRRLISSSWDCNQYLCSTLLVPGTL